MDMTALLLSRLQFAFTITFHIIFSLVHHRVGSLANCARGAASCDRNDEKPAAEVHHPVRHHRRRSGAPQSSLAFMFWGAG